MKHKTIIEEENDELFDPVEWKCDTCNKIKAYSQTELEKAECPRPGTQPEDWDWHVPCPFCKKGSMFPPTVSLEEGLRSILDCDI